MASTAEEIGYIDPLRWESWVLREPWIIEELIDEVARHVSDWLNEWKRLGKEMGIDRDGTLRPRQGRDASYVARATRFGA